MSDLYRTLSWRIVRARAIERDGGCILAGRDRRPCSGALHVHHIVRPELGGEPYALANLATVCARHHRLAHTLGFELREPGPARCPHRHPTRAGRLACERERARRAA
jgi:hypothetical protein